MPEVFRDALKVSLTMTTLNGCSGTYSEYVHVNSLPKADFTAANTCQMDSVTFTNNSLGSDYFRWWLNDSLLSSSKTASYRFLKAGTFRLKLEATNASGCTDSITKTITIYPKPYAHFMAENACVGEPIIFKDSVAAGNNEILTSEQWAFGDGDGDKGHNPVHAFTKAGKYGVQLLVSSSHSCSTLFTDTVIIYPQPTEQYHRQGDSLYVENTYASYQWYRNDSSINGANQSYYIIKLQGYYTVLLTNGQGCTDSSSSQYEGFTGINSPMASDIEIYPNPSFGIFNIKANHPFVYALFRVYDSRGRECLRGNMDKPGIVPAVLNLNTLPAGIYQLVIIDGNMLYRAKLMLTGK